jgi:hypothetical protein
MKLKPPTIEKLSDLLLKNLQDHGSLVLKADAPTAIMKLRDIITKNFAEEEEIEQEAREILASHSGQIRDVDEHRLFLLTKQRIAQKRGFVL